MKRISSPIRAIRRALAVFGPAIVVGIAAVGAFAVPHVDAADNTLVSSSPAAGSTIESSPPSLLLTFATALGATNTVEVVCNGAPIAVGTPQVGLDGVSLSVSVPNPLPKGECACRRGWSPSPTGRAVAARRSSSRSPTTPSPPSLRRSRRPPPVSTPATGSTAAPVTPTDTHRRHVDVGIRIGWSARSLAAADLARRRRSVRFAGADRDRMAGGCRVHPDRTVPSLGLAADARLRHLQRRLRRGADLGQGHRQLAVTDVVGRPHRHDAGHRRTGAR